VSEKYGPQTSQITAFLARLAELSFEDLGGAVDSWRGLVTGPDWHEAEDHLSVAISETRRFHERERVLEHIYQVFRRSPWFTERKPDSHIPGSDASAQYVTTVALFALLVCDRLSAHDFDVLYSPFAGCIPPSQLEDHRREHEEQARWAEPR
jgi:hypothetical protein